MNMIEHGLVLWVNYSYLSVVMIVNDPTTVHTSLFLNFKIT
jgi:hypothetical protein